MKFSRHLRGIVTVLALLAVTPVTAAAASDVAVYDHDETTVVGPREQQSFSTAAAGTGDDIVFNGAGSHHSVGLSQYGARGQAQEGRSATTITRTYYSGTSVERRDAPYDIRVGVVRDAPRIRYVPRDGDAAVYFKADDRGPATATQDSAWRVDPLGEDLCRTRGPDFDHTGTCPAFDPNGALEVQTPKGSDWSRYRSYGQDAIVRTVADRPGTTWLLDIVVELSLETYLYGLAEVPYSWEPAALQAQAIAGRSFALHRMLDTGQFPDRGCSCHVWDSQRDQVYAGYDREVSARWDRWRAAVDGTAGQVVVADPRQVGYGDTADGIVQTFYSASSYGKTEAKHESPAFSSGRWDYMLSVPDRWSLAVSNNPYASWTRAVPRTTVAARVGLSRIDDVEVVARNESGSARTVRFSGAGNSKDLSADEVRRTFGLLSNGFSVDGAGAFFPRDVFEDDDDSIHEEDIDWLSGQDITKGCNPPSNSRFCPQSNVTRGQMAAFLVRALDLPEAADAGFRDVPPDHLFHDDISRLAAAGITVGCNPSGTRYCPDSVVRREQMAAFLSRALDLRSADHPGFRDVGSRNTFDQDIRRLAVAGVTKGCNPPTNDRFCPRDPVSRQQMASFLRRAAAAGG